jgi:hypothetical protein
MILNLHKRPVKKADLHQTLWHWRTALAVLGLMGWTCLLLHQQLGQLQFGAATTAPPSAATTGALPSLCPSPARPVARACVDKGKRPYKPFLSAVDQLEDDPNDVPPLVRAWRRAKLDFHDIKCALHPLSLSLTLTFACSLSGRCWLRADGALSLSLAHRIADRFRSEDRQYTKLDKLLQMHNGKQLYGPLYNYEFCKVRTPMVPHECACVCVCVCACVADWGVFAVPRRQVPDARRSAVQV